MSASTAEAVVALERAFDAPVARVFAAWSDPRLIAQWFGAPGYTVRTCSADLRVGGRYQITLTAPNGAELQHHGEYLEIEPPRRLVFTWELDNQDCPGSRGVCVSSLVSLDLREQDGGTYLQLLHERLPTASARQGHRQGWQACLDSLSQWLD